MKIRQFWQFHGLNGWKYEKNLKKGAVCDEVPYNKLYRRGNVPDQNGDIFCHFAVFFALKENWAAKTFFEITVQYLQVKMIRNLQTMKLLYHADK